MPQTTDAITTDLQNALALVRGLLGGKIDPHQSQRGAMTQMALVRAQEALEEALRNWRGPQRQRLRKQGEACISCSREE